MTNSRKLEAANADVQVVSNSFDHDYAHHQRLAKPGPDFVLPNVHLKWYDIYRPDVGISAELIDASRSFLQQEVESERLNIATEYGFAMLHLGDEPGSRNTFAMLFVCTWRNGNELWRTLYTKSLRTNEDFERFVEDGHIGAFCVWELGPVWHERQAWTRFLYSARDDGARDVYLGDNFEGLV
jgi:hypothetical protein